ncbi:MAG: hypothetical protein ACU83P_13065 [Gammaproteobacteria bacterium]
MSNTLRLAAVAAFSFDRLAPARFGFVGLFHFTARTGINQLPLYGNVCKFGKCIKKGRDEELKPKSSSESGIFQLREWP